LIQDCKLGGGLGRGQGQVRTNGFFFVAKISHFSTKKLGAFWNSFLRVEIQVILLKKHFAKFHQNFHPQKKKKK
jgi:hypothetical protein